MTSPKALLVDSKSYVVTNSQGTAVIDNAVQGLSSEARDQVKGIVLYGYTRNKQDEYTIPDFSKDKVKVICAEGDLVCAGTLIITPLHFSYAGNIDDATDYYASRLS